MQQANEPGQAAVLDKMAASALLVREANHRAKNSLQLAISLLQARAIRLAPAETHTRTAIAETCDRLRALSRVHELLYRETHFGEAVDFGRLLRELTGDLAASFATRGQIVRWAVEADRLCLNPDTAIPLALIATAAVSNAFKHAFPAGWEGMILVRLRVMCRGAVLLIADNGIGIPPKIQPGSFGLQLIRSLAKQIGGAARVRGRNGTVVGVRIPLGTN